MFREDSQSELILTMPTVLKKPIRARSPNSGETAGYWNTIRNGVTQTSLFHVKQRKKETSARRLAHNNMICLLPYNYFEATVTCSVVIEGRVQYMSIYFLIQTYFRVLKTTRVKYEVKKRKTTEETINILV